MSVSEKLNLLPMSAWPPRALFKSGLPFRNSTSVLYGIRNDQCIDWTINLVLKGGAGGAKFQFYYFKE